MRASFGTHQSRNVVQLATPFPEVLTANLVWDQTPQPSDILRLLASIPEVMTMDELYECSRRDGEARYVFRGMVCFQGAHYYAFFRRLFIKYDF